MKKIRVKLVESQRNVIHNILAQFLSIMNSSNMSNLSDANKISWSIIQEVYPSFRQVPYKLTYIRSFKYHEAYILNATINSYLTKTKDVDPFVLATVSQINNQIEPHL